MPLLEDLPTQGRALFRKRGTIPIYLLIAGMIIGVISWKFEYLKIQFVDYEKLKIAAFLLSSLGMVIRMITVGLSAPNTSGRNTDNQVADSLNTTGMYSITRNPLYLGNYLMYLGIAILTNSLPFLIIYSLLFWIYYERIIYAEEIFLRNKFGDQYLSWARQTPIFIPNFRNWKRSGIYFNWKKVLRNEKNGIFALFLVFCIFDKTMELIVFELIHFEIDYLVILTATTGVLYLVLKFLKHKTKILHSLDE